MVRENRMDINDTKIREVVLNLNDTPSTETERAEKLFQELQALTEKNDDDDVSTTAEIYVNENNDEDDDDDDDDNVSTTAEIEDEIVKRLRTNINKLKNTENDSEYISLKMDIDADMINIQKDYSDIYNEFDEQLFDIQTERQEKSYQDAISYIKIQFQNLKAEIAKKPENVSIQGINEAIQMIENIPEDFSEAMNEDRKTQVEEHKKHFILQKNNLLFKLMIKINKDNNEYNKYKKIKNLLDQVVPVSETDKKNIQMAEKWLHSLKNPTPTQTRHQKKKTQITLAEAENRLKQLNEKSNLTRQEKMEQVRLMRIIQVRQMKK